MSQLQETRCLTPEQIKTTLTNWFKILHVNSYEVLSEGKPVFSKENEEKWKLPHITKFADRYTLYRCVTEVPKPHDDYKEVQQPKVLFIITLETNKFDKLNISACIWYYHLFEKELDHTLERPQVFICPTFVVTDTMTLHVPTNVFPCLYRFISLCEMYPMIGSRTGMFGMTWDYKNVVNKDGNKIVPDNGREYSTIYSFDLIVKVLNALPHDIIQCKSVRNEGTAYGQYDRREVIDTTNDINIISPSGICDGRE